MDLKLDGNGDLAVDEAGNLQIIENDDELLQEAFIALSAKKGMFIYDRSLGSELYKLFGTENYTDENVTAEAREALCRIPEAEVTDVELLTDKIIVTVDINGQEYSICVKEE